MDIYILKLLVVGLLLLLVTLGSGWISRLPISYALIYLIVGIILSPYGFNLIQLRPDAEFLERVTEFVVIISLFSCGLKMNRPLRSQDWNSTIRLIGLLMPITIFAIAAIGHVFLNFSWGAAILMGAILAPTDPVLASEVQLADANDQDELRFGLTSEGGLNDALAFPFVYFGLRWLNNDHWQDWFKEWIAIDIIWAISAALVMGVVISRVIVGLDKRLQEVVTTDKLMEDFVALSIVLVTYSSTQIVHGYGFLAVFIAGIVTQRSYRDPAKRSSQLEFMEIIEKLMEVGIILLLGSLLRVEQILQFLPQSLLVAGLLFFVVRPLGAWMSTIGERYTPLRRWLFGWFGIRGAGSLYYLFYALGKGLKGDLGEQLAWITFTTIALSVLLHGVSSTPLMNCYQRHINALSFRRPKSL